MTLLWPMHPLPERRLTQQAVFIPEEGVYLKSGHQHDYTGHEWVDKEGVKRSYFLDGGTTYRRRAGDLDLVKEGRVIEWSTYSDDPFEVYRDKLLWGTRGKDGKTPLRWVPLSECSLDHLRAIQKTQPQIVGTVVERVVEWWIREKEGS